MNVPPGFTPSSAFSDQVTSCGICMQINDGDQIESCRRRGAGGDVVDLPVDLQFAVTGDFLRLVDGHRGKIMALTCSPVWPATGHSAFATGYVKAYRFRVVLLLLRTARWGGGPDKFPRGMALIPPVGF